ncbi:hypothetical protein J32TS6_05420 [Virgibacillus pantothenticus]|nr:hypothetical protein J32TS6_05420 [Virgibacillus pantothenticus]
MTKTKHYQKRFENESNKNTNVTSTSRKNKWYLKGKAMLV